MNYETIRKVNKKIKKLLITQKLNKSILNRITKQI